MKRRCLQILAYLYWICIQYQYAAYTSLIRIQQVSEEWTFKIKIEKMDTGGYGPVE